MGPIPIDDNIGKEIISRFGTGVNNVLPATTNTTLNAAAAGGKEEVAATTVVYTDANGREFQKRLLCVRVCLRVVDVNIFHVCPTYTDPQTHTKHAHSLHENHLFPWNNSPSTNPPKSPQHKRYRPPNAPQPTDLPGPLQTISIPQIH